jgi:hypothetical protein
MVKIVRATSPTYAKGVAICNGQLLPKDTPYYGPSNSAKTHRTFIVYTYIWQAYLLGT